MSAGGDGHQVRDGRHPYAVVLGLGQNGMATVRALGRSGIPVIGIDDDLSQPSAQTRYARKVHCPDFEAGGPALIDCLMTIGRRLDDKAVLFPSGDMNLIAISDNRDVLGEFYHVALPPKDIVRMFLDKKAFYRFAMERDFPIPKTFFPESPAAIKDIAERIAYPCLIKPFQPTTAWRTTFDTRLFVANSPDELFELFPKLFAVHQDLIVQEYMTGDDSDLWWSGTYVDRHGRPLVMFTGRKLRQYPRRFGSTSFAESRWEPWIAEATTDILRTAGHRGLAFAEFKRDARDGQFKLTEVTAGRTWFPHALVTRAGYNLPLMMYRDVLGLPVETPPPYTEGLKWIHEERDLRTVVLHFLPKGDLTVWSWLKSYRGRRVYAYASWDDPRPFVAAMKGILATAWRQRPFRARKRRAGG